MTGRKLICTFFFLFVFLLCIFPEKLIFKYQKGVKYKIITVSNVDVYFDNQYGHSIETLYKVSVDIVDAKDKSGYLSGIYRVSEKGSTDDSIYMQKDDEIAVSYWCDELGKYSSGNRTQLLPQVRDVPCFLNKELAPGDSWEAPGKEIFDLQEFGINNTLTVPLKVSYVYIKNETINGVNCAILRIYYTFSIDLLKYAKYDANIPGKITGFNNQRFVFDIKNGRPYYYEDDFSTMYLFLAGDIVEFRGKSRGDVIEGTELKKDDVVKEIEEAIKKEGIKDAAVKKEDDGVKIILEDIKFQPDSDILLPAEQEKIKKIGKILEKFPERDIFIGGHTALAGTEEGRQQLSEQRAKAVGEFLLSTGSCNDTQLTYKGFGARIPLGDNSTPEGMKKNRRVEIKILEN